MKYYSLTMLTAFFTVSLLAQNEDKNNRDSILQADIDGKADYYSDVSQKIWGFAELGYQEYKSSELLQQVLTQEGFQVQNNVAEIPTAFIASFGSGKPIIGILGEFDALPGVSQDATPER